MLPETLPTAQGVGDTETKRLALRAFFLWAVQGSNLRPPACKAGALPTELTARVCPQRDSNPRCSLERAVTLTASRWGRAADSSRERAGLHSPRRAGSSVGRAGDF